MDYSVKPIRDWPGKITKVRQRDKFGTSYAKTLDMLDREIRKLAGRQVVIQLALEFGQIRNDGRPYADAKPTHPGVIVCFNSKYGPLSYSTDRYLDWHANVRAIALALEALRTVDRYGVSREGSQYTGYKQLAAAAVTTGNGTGILAEEDAAKFIAEHSDVQAQFIFADK